MDCIYKICNFVTRRKTKKENLKINKEQKLKSLIREMVKEEMTPKKKLNEGTINLTSKEAEKLAKQLARLEVSHFKNVSRKLGHKTTKQEQIEAKIASINDIFIKNGLMRKDGSVIYDLKGKMLKDNVPVEDFLQWWQYSEYEVFRPRTTK